MTYRGLVQKNVVVLENGVSLPEGTVVLVQPLPPESDKDETGTLLERLRDVVGAVPDLPEDLAENHDHYLHGTPKC